MMIEKVLTQLLEQYQAKHGCLPKTIYVHPVALVALAIYDSAAPVWRGVPVKVKEVKPGGVSTGDLGIAVIDDALRSFDL